VYEGVSVNTQGNVTVGIDGLALRVVAVPASLHRLLIAGICLAFHGVGLGFGEILALLMSLAGAAGGVALLLGK